MLVVGIAFPFANDALVPGDAASVPWPLATQQGRQLGNARIHERSHDRADLRRLECMQHVSGQAQQVQPHADQRREATRQVGDLRGADSVIGHVWASGDREIRPG